jgi:hypothetical protein
MKKKNLTLLLLLVTSIITVYSKNPEKLIGISLDNDKKEITISVVSTGCTNKNDFELICKNGILTVNRLKPDYCKAMEEVVTFTYSFATAKIDANKPFTISNKFIANPFLAKIK